jgi:hypothetical protein
VLGGPLSGLPALPDALESSHEIVVDAASYPFLASHRVHGSVVVPVALVVEWFARVARACRPALTLGACRELRVLRGIVLPDFERGASRFLVHVRAVGDALEMTLAGDGGVRHYVATCERSATPPETGTHELELGALRPWTTPIYDGKVLFHGPDFRVIEAIEGASDVGIVADLVGLRERGWRGTSWQLDPAVLDGGLQPALLWARREVGAAGLPTAIQCVRVHHLGPANGRVRCVLHGRDAARERTIVDVSLMAEDGSLLAELVGVEVHSLPRSGRHPDAASELHDTAG